MMLFLVRLNQREVLRFNSAPGPPDRNEAYYRQNGDLSIRPATDKVGPKHPQNSLKTTTKDKGHQHDCWPLLTIKKGAG